MRLVLPTVAIGTAPDACGKIRVKHQETSHFERVYLHGPLTCPTKKSGAYPGFSEGGGPRSAKEANKPNTSARLS